MDADHNQEIGTVTLQEHDGKICLEMYGQAVVPGSAILNRYVPHHSLVFLFRQAQRGNIYRCRINIGHDSHNGLWTGSLEIEHGTIKISSRVTAVVM